MLRLFDAARRTGHELLLEIIPSRSAAPVDERTLARALDRFYALGVFPDWWKLPDPGEPGGLGADRRRRSSATIRIAAACCCWASTRPLAELEASFALAARQPVCKGFAIGRTIFGAPARAWMRGRDRRCDRDRAHGRDLRQPDRRPGTARPASSASPPANQPTAPAVPS